MAQVILRGIGQALGGQVGALIGGLLGGAADTTLVNSLGPARQVGARLDSVRVGGSTEGDPIKQVFGRARVAGTVIWAARLKENRSTTRASKTAPKTESFSYSLSFALALGEGPIDGIGRVWADGQLFDIGGVAHRLYRGTEDQLPDALIEAVEGTAPAYRGLAYLVFEDLDITQFGNRPPNLSVEVFRRPRGPFGDLESLITAVCLIPGAGEFVYGATAVSALSGLTRATPENGHAGGRTDFAVALDQMAADLPNLTHVNLVVSWFGTSLDAGSCQVVPGVETASKLTTVPWSVAGFGRADAHLVSQIILESGARPAYGGTPSDAVVHEAIVALKARGYDVTLIPFVLMDCAGYPWRGRITSAGDGTAMAASDVAAFMAGGFADFVRHMAALGQAAGADAIVLGSELRGLTQVRDGVGGYPMVAALRALAAEVRVIAPALKIGYGADWTEYGAHVVGDDVVFHLDPLWSDTHIDFVGIDWYAPLSDWRDGARHLDAADAASIYDQDYLASRVRGGEGFDWYYASEAAHYAQIRTPIVDSAHGEDWVFRPKDLLGWWSSSHHDRPGGVRSATATGWTPGMKPVRLIEIGCAAIDKGPNAPNRFLDPKSSESAIPPYSTGERDDRAQRVCLQVLHDFYADPDNNPGMITDMAVWCYDARPYPWFPRLGQVWGDAGNWRTGHWLNGRLGGGEARNLVADIATQAGITADELDLDEVSGTLEGYVIEQPMSGVDALTPVLTVLGVEAGERGGKLAFVAAGHAVDAVLARDDLALNDEDPVTVRRDLVVAPASLMLRAYDADRDYQLQAVHVRRDGMTGEGQLSVDLALCLSRVQAQALAGDLLAQARSVRETVNVDIDPLLALRFEVGDTVQFDGGQWRVSAVDMDEQPSLTLSPAPGARSASLADPSLAEGGPGGMAVPVMTGFILMDLPCFGVDEADARPVLVASSDPWAGVDVYAGASPVSLRLRGRVEQAAGIGRTLDALLPQRPHVLLRAASLDIYLEGEPPSSRSLEEVLAGANLVCVRAANDEWELIQFLDATVLGVDQYRLSGLIRGQWGSEQALSAGIAADAEVVVLPSSLTRAQIGSDELRLDRLWRSGRIGFGGVAAGAMDAHATWTGLGLRPRAPVFGRVTGTGDLTVSWLRSPRYGGDSWDAEPPLCEDYELYRVQVFDGAVLKRSVELASPEWGYALADQVADFPSGFGGDARIEIAQRSQVVGWGPPLRLKLS